MLYVVEKKPHSNVGLSEFEGRVFQQT